jgi:predicted acyl esterase
LAVAGYDHAAAAEILTSESASEKSQTTVLEETKMTTESEVRDGMRVDWDVEIRMPDGVTLRCDIFRPLGEERVPALVTYGPSACSRLSTPRNQAVWGLGCRSASRLSKRMGGGCGRPGASRGVLFFSLRPR